MKALLIGLLALPLAAQQTPVVPAGLIYQAAASQGINYISPSAGQAIINTKAVACSLNIDGNGALSILQSANQNAASFPKGPHLLFMDGAVWRLML